MSTDNVLAFPKRKTERVQIAVPAHIKTSSAQTGEISGSDLIGLQIYPGDFICFTTDFNEEDFHPNELFTVRVASGFHVPRIVKATAKTFDLMRGCGEVKTFKRSEVEIVGRVFAVQRRKHEAKDYDK